jgi:hypothetical protein
MSNVQRVAGPLFAKVRDVQTKLDSVGFEVDHVTWQLTRVKVELEYVTRKLDEERRLIRMSFALVVAILAGIQYSIQWMIWTGHHSACFVPQDRNATDDVHHETDMARSLVRIIADEWFAWLFLRPWYE